MIPVPRLLAGGLAALLVNSAYLAARADASLFYYSNVALHGVLGIAVALIALAALIRLPQRGRAMLLVLLAAAGAGLYLSIVGATRAHRIALIVHAVLGSAGALGALGVLAPGVYASARS